MGSLGYNPTYGSYNHVGAHLVFLLLHNPTLNP